MNDLVRELKIGCASAPPQDLAWESELLHLLSTLEAFRAQLHDDCLAGRTLASVEALLAVAKGVAAFVRSRCKDILVESGGTLEASEQAFLAVARPLHDRLDDDVFKALRRLFQRRRDPRDPKEQFADAAGRLKVFLNVAFGLCGVRFISPTARRSWTETYAVFLDDIAGLIERVQPGHG